MRGSTTGSRASTPRGTDDLTGSPILIPPLFAPSLVRSSRLLEPSWKLISLFGMRKAATLRQLTSGYRFALLRKTSQLSDPKCILHSLHQNLKNVYWRLWIQRLVHPCLRRPPRHHRARHLTLRQHHWPYLLRHRHHHVTNHWFCLLRPRHHR